MDMKHKSTFLSVKNIGVTYSGKRGFLGRKHQYQVLSDISFDINSGDSIGVIGRNGVGKSTLLKVLAGIILPDVGSIHNAGVKVSLLTLQTGFDGEITGRRNIILSGLLLGFNKTEITGQLDSIIEFSELGKFIDRPVKTYSTGMMARLGFSISHKLEPEILLIDEILGVGDAEFKEKSNRAIKEKLLSEQTIVLVSHYAETIKTLCNKALWIENGFKMMFGDSSEVVDAYEKYICSESGSGKQQA